MVESESEKELGKIGFDLARGKYWGEVLHLCGKERFYAESVEDLRRLLRESVPERQGGATKMATPADEPTFESLVIHLEPLLFYRLNQQAMLHGKSLHCYIVDVLEASVVAAQMVEPLP
jgi:predicted HicB family RNase H-like nuclease